MYQSPSSKASCAVRATSVGTARAQETDAALVSGVDHVIWGVPDLAHAVDRLCRGMGFVRLEPPSEGTAAVRLAGLTVRLVEKPQGSRPIGIALRSRFWLTEAERHAVSRGLASSGIFRIAATRGTGELACFLIPDVVAPGDPGLLLVQPMSSVPPPALGNASASASVQVDVAGPDAVARWQKVLGTSANFRQLGLQLRPANQDGLAAILLRAADLWSLQQSWKSAGIDCFFAGGRLIVPASQTGGLPIEVAEG